MWRRRGFAAACAACCLAAAIPPQAAAAVTRHDLDTCLRMLGFLQPVPNGVLDAAIVFPRGSAAGAQQARDIAALFGDGLPAGAATIRPRIVEAEALARENVALVILTPAAASASALVAQSVSGRAILTVAFDRAPVEADDVVMAVSAEPRVDILVSRIAAQKAGVSFAAAFRMLIRER